MKKQTKIERQTEIFLNVFRQTELFTENLIEPLKKQIVFYKTLLNTERLNGLRELTTQKEFENSVTEYERLIAKSENKLKEILKFKNNNYEIL